MPVNARCDGINPISLVREDDLFWGHGRQVGNRRLNGVQLAAVRLTSDVLVFRLVASRIVAAIIGRGAWRMHRSYLFVPGNRPDRYAKACASRAHAVIIDLGDAVAARDKVGARQSLVGWLTPGRRAMVRVNAPGSEWFADDLRACTS